MTPKPSNPGICTSRKTRSGLCSRMRLIASSPFLPCATTSTSPTSWSKNASSSRANCSSSTITADKDMGLQIWNQFIESIASAFDEGQREPTPAREMFPLCPCEVELIVGLSGLNVLVLSGFARRLWGTALGGHARSTGVRASLGRVQVALERFRSQLLERREGETDRRLQALGERANHIVLLGFCRHAVAARDLTNLNAMIGAGVLSH